jgi:type III secretion protein L
LVGLRTILGQMPADERMRRLVTRAIAQVEIPGSLSLHVHPDDAAAAAEAIEALPDGGSMAIRIVADAALPVGACRLQSEFGSVEAGLSSQLEAVTQALAGVAGARGLAHPDAPGDSPHA